MVSCTANDYEFPPLPLQEWKDTKDTLHLFAQIIGKIRLHQHPKLNHWWHVTLYPSSVGLTSGRIPYCGHGFEVEFDFIEHQLKIRTDDDKTRQFSLENVCVADFYKQTFDALHALNIDVPIYPHPYLVQFSQIPFAEDTVHCAYNTTYVGRYHQALNSIASVFEEFRGRFSGKSTPVQLYWHSFDLVVTRFSGRSAPPRTEGTNVDQEAYSHEVISFGFWPGDETFMEPAFYSYTYPEPQGLTTMALKPESAFWQPMRNSHMSLLRYEDMRRSSNPKATLLDFLESAYQIGTQKAEWPIENLKHQAVY